MHIVLLISPQVLFQSAACDMPYKHIDFLQIYVNYNIENKHYYCNLYFLFPRNANVYFEQC